MRGWLVSLVLVACYGPHAETGAPCQPKAPLCPSGQLCVLRGDNYVCDSSTGTIPDDAPVVPIDAPLPPPDAAMFDATPADLDGDGVPNMADNCPTVPNPDQYNEDGDRFGDACDPCPPIADDNPADSDNDGVADACDPNPTTAGDKIVLFDGFHANLSAGWHPSGTWTVANDVVKVDQSGGGRANLTIAGPTTRRLTVTTSATVLDVGASGDAAIGVLDAYDRNTSPRKGVGCHLTRWGSSTPLAVVPMHDAPEHDMPFEFNVGQTYTIRQLHDGTSYACNARRGTAQQTVTLDSGLAPAAPEVGLRVTNAAASYAWIMVVSSGP